MKVVKYNEDLPHLEDDALTCDNLKTSVIFRNIRKAVKLEKNPYIVNLVEVVTDVVKEAFFLVYEYADCKRWIIILNLNDRWNSQVED